uniref:Uncharacterized protein n=1 Tax=viral metagenome TaxID=1070528 RepID=A0A6M3MEF8_9ZZZZ
MPKTLWEDPPVTVDVNFMFFQEDQRAKNRKKKINRNKHLKKVGIRVWQAKRIRRRNRCLR